MCFHPFCVRTRVCAASVSLLNAERYLRRMQPAAVFNTRAIVHAAGTFIKMRIQLDKICNTLLRMHPTRMKAHMHEVCVFGL